MRARQPVILVADDEAPARKLISMNLAAREYEVVTASDGAEALKIFEELPVDLVLLDISMPGPDGFQVCKRIREISDVPIVILSARGKEFDKVTALDMGADDYLTKPFGVGELLARVRAALRRGVRDLDTGNGKYEFGALSIDLSSRRVLRAGQDVKLTPTEFSLLSLFVRNAGKVLTHRYVLEAVWGSAYTDEREYLRAYVYNLRRKIEPTAKTPQHILNVPGVGYQFSTGGPAHGGEAAAAVDGPAAADAAAAIGASVHEDGRSLRPVTIGA